MMEKARISIVAYLNSKPFLYGLTNSAISGKVELYPEIPSKVVSKLAYNLADIGLIPVAGLEELEEYQIVSKYCIGAVGKVRTVVLASDVPLENVETILMDYQSRSSVLLAKVLAKFFWKKEFQWKRTCVDFENKLIKGKSAGVIIGDRVFDAENRFPYIYDLSEEWYKFTQLPFVFAIWAANKKVSQQFQQDFDMALDFGIKNIDQLVALEQKNYPNVKVFDYFTQNISFEFDDLKKAGMKKFLELAKKLEPVQLT